MCCCNCSFSADFLCLPECHNISHVGYFDSCSFHAVCVCWLEILWQELFTVPTDFAACKLTGMLLSEARVRMANSFSFCVWYPLQPLTVITQTTRLKQPDFFHTTISINEVITERIIKCHLRMERNWCFKHRVQFKALTCQSYQLCNNAVLLISTCLLHTDHHFTDFKIDQSRIYFSADNWHVHKHTSYRSKYTQTYREILVIIRYQLIHL